MTQETSAESEPLTKIAEITEPEKFKDKKERNKPFTKIVVRRLPPSMTLETFIEQVSPIPEHDYIYFVRADMSFGQHAFSRAYINFLNQEDLLRFKEQFDSYVFLDSKGREFPAVVEFATFQKIPKKRQGKKKDPKSGTLEEDPAYISFLEELAAEQKETGTSRAGTEYFPSDEASKEVETTPLIDFLKQRRTDRQKMKDERKEERRRKEAERRRIKEEERRKKKENETPKTPQTSEATDVDKPKPKPDKDKEKAGVTKRKEEDRPVKTKEKKTFERTSDRSREAPAKSYRDERQRQSEARNQRKLAEEKKKKSFENSRSGVDKKDGSSSATRSEKWNRKVEKLVGGIKHDDVANRNKNSENWKTLEEVERAMHKEERKTEESISDNKETDEVAEKDDTEVVSTLTRWHSLSSLYDENKIKTRRRSLDLIEKIEVTFLKEKNDKDDESSKEIAMRRRRGSLDSEGSGGEKSIRRNLSLELEGSESGEKEGKKDPRSERRIRNKDRPSLEIYRPGMGRFSMQRREKDSNPPLRRNSVTKLSVEKVSKPLKPEKFSRSQTPGERNTKCNYATDKERNFRSQIDKISFKKSTYQNEGNNDEED